MHFPLATWTPHNFFDSQNLSAKDATRLAGEEPDYGARILYEAIVAKNFPRWTVYIVSIF